METRDLSLSEFLEISVAKKDFTGRWRVEVDTESGDQVYVEACIGKDEYEAKEDAYLYLLQVFDGGDSNRAFYRPRNLN